MIKGNCITQKMREANARELAFNLLMEPLSVATKATDVLRKAFSECNIPLEIIDETMEKITHMAQEVPFELGDKLLLEEFKNDILGNITESDVDMIRSTLERERNKKEE